MINLTLEDKQFKLLKACLVESINKYNEALKDVDKFTRENINKSINTRLDLLVILNRIEVD